ncbi:MAG: hypothetical protein COV29_02885 [Candidatus Yanofskybacteria bacterium CG10_big_fil_rev_8_21_14_0_10_36_16]|uniref:Dipeptidylpeptidase IV N-terminal domain-containing protein n=1 Tax=Candidatus Yanofskybacteria bacterium CG10_big_fil_rev_8_21_14_0_10_36_16 TaxID=1975096 RepID=A0A2J0Q9J6_9BACT|nr:MAG: hypothetical protein COV29_02885 [Candidatus Yanofskybacteria bacterium CG10_big_fil_rev_8_21_14_0_10_36_16]
MVKYSYKIKKTVIIMVAATFLLGGFVFVLPFSKADFVLGEDGISVVYSSSHTNGIMNESITKGFWGNVSNEIKTIDNNIFSNYKKSLFVSPNRKYIAVTIDRYEGHDVRSYIIDIDGKMLTDIYYGSFVAWSPNNDKILLFLSGIDNSDGRKIYYLSLDNDYLDSGLPEGVISADISPINGDIIYSLTKKGTSESSLYIRSDGAVDELVLQGDKNIFAWVRWSSSGDKVAFLKSDLMISARSREIWIMSSDGSDLKKISSVEWGYPPVWSPDNDKLLYGYFGNIWEYNAKNNYNKKLTGFSSGHARYPTYSSDGNIVVFTSNFSNQDQLWVIQNKNVMQITSDGEEKTYPILP